MKMRGVSLSSQCTSLGVITLQLLLLFCPSGQPANILLMPFPYRSHVTQISIIGRGLVETSRHVVYVMLPKSYPDLSQYEANWPFHVISYEPKEPDIYTTMLSQSAAESGSPDWIDVALQSDPVTELRTNVAGFVEFCTNPLGDADLLRRLRDIHLDLAVVDACPMSRCYWILAHQLQIGYVSVTSQYEPWLMRVPALPSFVPFTFSAGGLLTERMDSFADRLSNVIGLIDWSAWPRLVYVEDEFVARYLPAPAGQPQETYATLAARSLVWFIDTDVALDFPRPTMPNEVNIGGLSTGPAKQLPADSQLKSFAESAVNGLIVASFGSIDLATQRFKQQFYDAFKQLSSQYHVIWRYSGEMSTAAEDLPKNVFVSSWLPQNDLIGHANTRLLITHCGANSLYEAVYHGVPVLCLTLWGDQPANAARMHYYGYGRSLGRMRDVTAAGLVAAVHDVIGNKSYAETARTVSAVFRSRDMTPKQRAVWWIEHVLQFGGHHLHCHGVDVPWWQYLMLDILAVCLLLPTVLVTSSVTAVTCYCCCLRRVQAQHFKQN